MSVLVTGTAGFIGSHLSHTLLAEGRTVLGVDSLNRYYDPALKRARLNQLIKHPGFTFREVDICDSARLGEEVQNAGVTQVVHLAAQPGVRYSLENPAAYVHSNLVGFSAVIEIARRADVEHFVYASSSSVYGANTKLPFSVCDPVDHPVSFYGATKRSNELIAESYSRLYAIPSTGLRLFTTYGPRGRPDMAIFDFTRKIIRREPVHLFGAGELTRDFTFIDDVVAGIRACLDRPPSRADSRGLSVNDAGAPHRIFNIGTGQPVSVLELLEEIETAIGKSAVRVLDPDQPGDLNHTLADISETTAWCGYVPSTKFSDGVGRFVEWYREYYGA